MATPTVAGAAALIRQFLVQGRHAVLSSAGYAASSYDASQPSAALIKAMLIGSTSPLTYGYDSSGVSVALASFYGAYTALADSAAYPLGTPRSLLSIRAKQIL